MRIFEVMNPIETQKTDEEVASLFRERLLFFFRGIDRALDCDTIPVTRTISTATFNSYSDPPLPIDDVPNIKTKLGLHAYGMILELDECSTAILNYQVSQMWHELEGKISIEKQSAGASDADFYAFSNLTVRVQSCVFSQTRTVHVQFYGAWIKQNTDKQSAPAAPSSIK